MKLIGTVTDKVKKILGIKATASNILIASDGLRKHLIKRHHEIALKHFEDIAKIIDNPDYVGINPREKGTSLEYVKKIEDNMLVAIKLAKSEDYFYVASMYEITEAKKQRNIKNNRLRPFN